MDELDRAILNGLQGGFPICEHPYAEAAVRLGTTEAELIVRLERMLKDGLLSRFGPMYHAERMGGALCLAAMAVPPERFDEVNAAVNAFPEIAHNYERGHELNMWFVIATETPARRDEVIAEIEAATGLKVFPMPKIEEYFVGLRFAV